MTRGIKIKICGITRVADALVAAENGAWAVGLIFAPASSRCVTLARAKEISQALPKGVLRVGVFMDQELKDIQQMRQEAALDLVQIHGQNARELCSAMGPEQCIQVVDEITSVIKSEAAYVLLDRPRQKGEPVGKSLDLAVARQAAQSRKRVLLAGGLDAASVGAAVAAVAPFGVDVASGVESSPGIKDPDKIREFMRAARGAR